MTFEERLDQNVAMAITEGLYFAEGKVIHRGHTIHFAIVRISPEELTPAFRENVARVMKAVCEEYDKENK